MADRYDDPTEVIHTTLGTGALGDLQYIFGRFRMRDQLGSVAKAREQRKILMSIADARLQEDLSGETLAKLSQPLKGDLEAAAFADLTQHVKVEFEPNDWYVALIREPGLKVEEFGLIALEHPNLRPWLPSAAARLLRLKGFVRKGELTRAKYAVPVGRPSLPKTRGWSPLEQLIAELGEWYWEIPWQEAGDSLPRRFK
jgi:hypothetical protein